MKSQTLKHSHHKKRLTSFLLTASMMFSVSAGTESVLLSANTEVSAANSYGLADSTSEYRRSRFHKCTDLSCTGRCGFGNMVVAVSAVGILCRKQ